MTDTEICRFNDEVEDIEGLVNLLCVKDAKIACCTADKNIRESVFTLPIYIKINL